MSAGVLDAWAALALLRGEGEASLAMRRHLRRAHAGNLRLLMNLINLGEVYYRMAQLAGHDRADAGLSLIRGFPITLLTPREPLVLEAARLKASFKMSYADAFAVATARTEDAPVFTGDPEILALPKGVVKVRRLSR